MLRFTRLILFNFYLKIWNVTHLFLYIDINKRIRYNDKERKSKKNIS
ncbi:Hypothetical Cytosolic Protein [Fusobacterium vincentii ATCC 49256]|uniref:Hypothetical Cytosolic Protein n=1 Tax=Fusobacterium vincentii ATCC 49256 TaxID=209882 RepID=Q7P270_FUSVC|nr:Hypothetical Cytosolic Protein [Fusobacterium vincentii ATCC 49256]